MPSTNDKLTDKNTHCWPEATGPLAVSYSLSPLASTDVTHLESRAKVPAGGAPGSACADITHGSVHQPEVKGAEAHFSRWPEAVSPPEPPRAAHGDPASEHVRKR